MEAKELDALRAEGDGADGDFPCVVWVPGYSATERATDDLVAVADADDADVMARSGEDFSCEGDEFEDPGV